MNNRGQLTIEAVLLLVIFASVMFAGSRAMQENKVLSKVVQGPWTYLAGMIENGVWEPPKKGKEYHPHHFARHGSPEGDPL